MPNLKYAALTFASRNRDKYREYCALLGIADLTLSEIAVAESQNMNLEALVEEKILQVKKLLPKTPFFLEHTGLTIDEWKGLPGGLIGQFISTVGSKGLCKMMTAYKGSERLARARVVIGYFDPENGRRIFQGEVIGTIAQEPRGTGNFGWDDIFIPEGSTKTYAEMDLAEKNQTSMRKKAVDEFQRFLDLHFEL